MSVGDKNQRCYLISYVSDQDDAGFEPDTPQEIRKKVWCKVESISGREFARMGQNNIRPQCRVTLWADEYDEQDTVELEGKKYGVYRTFQPNPEEVELYLERKAGDA
ncbi:MAG: phage head closure protein [Lachnospiraceae bacterium]|nr:phage head closure protein [Lachnospiraceae bacterium]